MALSRGLTHIRQVSEGFQDLDSLRLCLKARLRGNSRGLRREMHKL
jgi:hypothetical protein